MKTDITVRKIILSAFTVFIIFLTTFIFNHTQSFYKTLTKGTRYFSHAKYQEALPFLMSAFKMQPRNFKAANMLLWNYQKLGMRKETEEMLNVILSANPQDIGIMKQLADAHYGLSDYAGAEMLYRKILTRTDTIDVKKKLAEVLVWQKKYDEALPLLDEAVKNKPRDLKLLEFFAEVNSWAKKFDKAIELYKKLLSLRYNENRIALKIADALRYSGRNEEAIQFYNEYLKRKK